MYSIFAYAEPFYTLSFRCHCIIKYPNTLRTFSKLLVHGEVYRCCSTKDTYYNNADIGDFLSQEFVCNR